MDTDLSPLPTITVGLWVRRALGRWSCRGAGDRKVTEVKKVIINRTGICVAICLSFPLNAVALDQSVAVRVTELIKTTNSWDDKPIVYPDGKAEITGLLVEIAPGAQTGWHMHPIPSFGMVLEGTLEVTLEDGRLKRLQAGDALAEVVNTSHNGHNIGNGPVKLVVFYAGTVGQNLTVKEPLSLNSAP